MSTRAPSTSIPNARSGSLPVNRLAAATSPYLRQHAGNPVHWREWDAEALAEAAERDVPVLLSIGYAACHWCHVMAHESFDDDEVAVDPEAQDRLLDVITELSPAGSRIAAEGVVQPDGVDEDEIRAKMKAVSDQWRDHGFDLDFSELVYTGDRAEVATYLTGHGWRTESIGATDLLVKCGLAPADGDNANFADIRYVSAVR